MQERKSFVMYKSFKGMISRLDMEQRGRLLTAIYEYVFDGKVDTELSEVADMAFCAMQDTFDRDLESYAEKCRINSINGQKGGRPRKTAVQPKEDDFSLPKTERFFEKAKKADNDNGNENNNDNDNDNGGGNENENKNNNDNADGGGNDNEYGGKGYVPTTYLPPHQRERKNFDPFEESAGARLSREESEILEKSGVPIKYAEERLERAAYYGGRQRMSRCEVLIEWWKDDGNRRRASYASAPAENSSFDTDEFFDLALQHSLE